MSPNSSEPEFESCARARALFNEWKFPFDDRLIFTLICSFHFNRYFVPPRRVVADPPGTRRRRRRPYNRALLYVYDKRHGSLKCNTKNLCCLAAKTKKLFPFYDQFQLKMTSWRYGPEPNQLHKRSVLSVLHPRSVHPSMCFELKVKLNLCITLSSFPLARAKLLPLPLNTDSSVQHLMIALV